MPANPACAGLGGKRIASRTPSHGRTGRGGRSRSGPTGGSANGTPANSAPPADIGNPRSRPYEVLMVYASVIP